MNNNISNCTRNVITVDFKNIKMRSLARVYVKLLVEYGVESASLWSMDNLPNKIEQKQFNNFVKQEMLKYGYKSYKPQ